MLEGLYAAAAGMAAQQRASEALANDIANLETPGYKTVRVQFRDLLYSREPSGASSGAGAAAELAGRSWDQGTLYDTGRPLDLAIEGGGFFEVRRANGASALTRNGAFGLDSRGRLTTADGELLVPGVTVPRGADVTQLTIGADGTATVGQTVVGRIRLVDVPARDRLLSVGSGRFEPTAASGALRPASSARVRHGQLEASNASPLELVGGQRTFQFLSRVVQAQDEMLATANKLRP